MAQLDMQLYAAELHATLILYRSVILNLPKLRNLRRTAIKQMKQ